MIKLLEIENDLRTTMSDEIPGMNMFVACGRNQPPRNYATSWSWQPDNDDEVHIFVSESLNKDKILEKLDPFLEKSTNISDLEKKLPEYLE